MNRARSWRNAALTLPLVICLGCQPEAPTKLKRPAVEPLVWRPSASAVTGFEAAAAHGAAASQIAEDLDLMRSASLSRSSREKLNVALVPAIGGVRSALQGEWNRPDGLLFKTGQNPKWLYGLNLVTKSMASELRRAAAAEDWAAFGDIAQDLLILGARISCGGPSEQSVGARSIADATSIIAEHLKVLPLDQLDQIAAAASTAESDLPELSDSYDLAEQKALLLISSIMEAYESGESDRLGDASRFGGKVAASAERLGRLKGDEVKGWFEGFQADVEAASDYYREQSSLPLADQQTWTKTGPREGWSDFLPHAVSPLTTVRSQHFKMLCRIRLIGVDAKLQETVLLTRQAPDKLDKSLGQNITDPYSGRPFCYSSSRVSSAWWDLYSTGPDGLNDGGQENDFRVRDDRA